MGTNLIRAMLLASASVVAAWAAFPTAAYAQEATFQIDIPAQSMGAALRSLGQKTKRTILFNEDLVRGKRSVSVRGRMTAGEALAKMVAGSGLVVSSNSSGFVVQGGNAEAAPARAESPEAAGVAEILVVGSKTFNVDIRRSEDDPQPYVVFSKNDIERSMSSTVESFLSSRLPMNTQRGTVSQNTPGSEFAGQSSINLRGLGTNQTLILVNGRRLPNVNATGLTGGVRQPDINGIPVSAIERIEVLPATSSGIYGGGATGGVVNIILKQDYRGVEAQISYESPFDTNAGSVKIDASAGLNFNEGRTNILLAGSYSRANPLLVRDRDFARRGRDLVLQNAPDALGTPDGYTANIRSTDGLPLVLKNGTALNSTITSVPVGYSGLGSDDGAALVGRAGQYNLDLPDTIKGLRSTIYAAPRQASVTANIKHSFNDRLDAYIDAGLYSNKSVSYTAGMTNFVFLNPGDTGNPFQNSVFVNFPSPNVQGETRTQSLTKRLVGGVIYRLPSRWAFSLDANLSQSSARSSGSAEVISNAGYQAIIDGDLDIFRDVNAFPLDYSPYKLPTPTDRYDPSRNTLKSITVRATGPLIRLPAGDVTLSAYAEQRQENIRASFAELNRDNVKQINFAPARSQDVSSLYGEIYIPVVSPSKASKFAQSLDMQASVRYDRYATRTTSTATIIVPDRNTLPDVTYTKNLVDSVDFTLAAKYAPTQDVSLRLSYGTGFLAPAIEQLVPRSELLDIYVTDPLRGNVADVVSNVAYTFGGNASLKPERSTSFSAGVILTPRFIPGFRFSADFVRLRKRDEITALFDDQIIALAEQLDGRVVRGANLPGDPPGYAGVITALDVSLVNIARAKVEALDFQADYTTDSPFGRFNFYVAATRSLKFVRQTLDTTDPIEFSGFDDGPLKWKGNAGVTWELDKLSISWNSQYYGRYSVYGGADIPFVDLSVPNALYGSNFIRSQTYHDFFVKYGFGDSPTSLLKNLEITAGIKNIFNDRPPTVASFGSTGGYSTYGDPRLRTFSVSIRKSF